MMNQASGDLGVGGAWKEDCGGKFDPSFPGTSPWVLCVGATIIDKTSGPSDSFPKLETGASLSSGGFSSIFDRPAYQAEAVDNFMRQPTLQKPMSAAQRISTAIMETDGDSDKEAGNGHSNNINDNSRASGNNKHMDSSSRRTQTLPEIPLLQPNHAFIGMYDDVNV